MFASEVQLTPSSCLSAIAPSSTLEARLRWPEPCVVVGASLCLLHQTCPSLTADSKMLEFGRSRPKSKPKKMCCCKLEHAGIRVLEYHIKLKTCFSGTMNSKIPKCWELGVWSPSVSRNNAFCMMKPSRLERQPPTLQNIWFVLKARCKSCSVICC